MAASLDCPVPGATLCKRSSCAVDTADGQEVTIYYEILRVASKASDQVPSGLGPPTRTKQVLFIMGFAATTCAWYPLLTQLQKIWARHPGPALEMLLIDNRGVGNSSSPKNKDAYTTTRMAKDALAVMDHVGWSTVHVVGFSMGGMIALKLGALAPERVLSMCVLSSSNGGMQVLPRSWKAWKYAFKAIIAKTAELRADVDLKFHFSKQTLKRPVPSMGLTVRDLLHAEYVEVSRTSRPQPEWGFKGQSAAVWHHSVTDADVQMVKNSKCPLWFIHGRHDLVAVAKCSEQMAERFGAPCVYVDGAHFIPRENSVEVACLLHNMLTLGHAPAHSLKLDPSLHPRDSLDALALQVMVGTGRTAHTADGPLSAGTLGEGAKATGADLVSVKVVGGGTQGGGVQGVVQGSPRHGEATQLLI